MHEDFSRRDWTTARSSERAFGLVMAGAFTVLALVPLWDGRPLRGWAVVVAGVFGALALLSPGALRPLNVAWTAFGLLLHRVTNPVLLALVFFGGVLPTGLLMRAFGRDPMRRRRDPAAPTYWIVRPPDEGSMTRQF